MIKRIVKLTFQEDKIATFKAIFEESKVNISNFEGCHHLELWQSTHAPNVLFTYSYWDNEAALNNYRHSEFFQKTWKRTKMLFDSKPEAWSVEVLDIAKKKIS